MASSINLTNQASRRGSANLIASHRLIRGPGTDKPEKGAGRAGGRTKPGPPEGSRGQLHATAHARGDARPRARGPAKPLGVLLPPANNITRCDFSTTSLL